MKDDHFRKIEMIQVGLQNIMQDYTKDSDLIWMYLDETLKSLNQLVKAIRKEKKDEKISK